MKGKCEGKSERERKRDNWEVLCEGMRFEEGWGV